MKWEAINFEDAVTSRGSGTSGLPQSKWEKEGKYPVIGQGAEYIEGWSNKTELLLTPKPAVVLYGGHTCRAKFVNRPFIPGPNVKILRPTDKLDAKFLFHFLSQLPIKDRGYADHFPEVRRCSIPLPPLDEQKRIAAVLDKADALALQRQESLHLTEKLLQSVFIDMFGAPISNSKNLPTDALSNLAKLERGKFTPRPRNDPSYFGGAHPFIQTGDITRSNGRITTWTQTLNEKGAAVSKEFRAGTVVIAIVGATLGETAIVETPVYCPDSIIGITPIPKKATPEFIEFLLRLWKPRLKQLAPDAARANLNLERLRPLRALAPDIDEQEKFSRTAQRLRELMLSKFESRDQLNNLFSSLQQRAFRDELDLSRLKLEDEAEPVAITPNPEPASFRGKYKRPGAFLAPPEIEAQLVKFEEILNLGPGDSIPWSEDYFKYRTLSQVLRPPFGFAEIWKEVHDDMPDAVYEDVRSKLFHYLEEGDLEQQFDEESREIVFAPQA